MPERTYWQMLDVLGQYEGQRCWWRVVAGGLLIASLPTLALGGFIAAAYLAANLHDPLQVLLGAVVAICLGQLLSGYVWRHRPWRILLEDRLWSYERPDPPGDLNAMIRSIDFDRATRALRRAKLNPIGGTHMPAQVSGVPDLDLKLIIHRSNLWHPPGSPELHIQIRDCLRAANIRANVAGEDLFPTA